MIIVALSLGGCASKSSEISAAYVSPIPYQSYTLGCLLGSQLGIHLRRVGSGTRYTFTNPGEQLLDKWMAQHAFVGWVETENPWHVEAEILSSAVTLPLNLAGKAKPETTLWLKAARAAARQQADQLEVIANNGGPRRSHIVRSAI